MHGLIRVRQFTLADAHIICRPDQLDEEFKAVLDLIQYIMKSLGVDKDVTYRFSKWSPDNKEKYIVGTSFGRMSCLFLNQFVTIIDRN